METQKLDQMQIGTLIHYVMMQLDPLVIASNTLKEDIDGQIDEMIKNGTINEDEKAYIRSEVLYDFFRSDVGTILRNAKRIEKESPFIIKMPAGEIDKAWIDSKDSILVQGMIDCWFETEDGHLVLIDYKTDMPKDEEQFRSIDTNIRLLSRQSKRLFSLYGSTDGFCRGSITQLLRDQYGHQKKSFSYKRRL